MDRYEVHFKEIGADYDQVHFLIQSVSSYNVTKLVTIIKNSIAREILKPCTLIKKAVILNLLASLS